MRISEKNNLNFNKKIKLNEVSTYFIFLLFIMAFFASIVMPSFTSPDEADHIKRAYLLTQGVFLLEPHVKGSGGMIDTGLLSYMNAYDKYQLPDSKIERYVTAQANQITWSGVEHFAGAPGTGYYFPIIYVPQALGLALGESLALSVDSSYKLARFLALLFVAIILKISFKFYDPPLIVLALLFIPMSLFQFASASLDGISTAVAIFVISIFIRIATNKESQSSWMLLLLSASVFVIASCRQHLMPLVCLIFATFFFTKNKKSLIAGFLTTSLLLVWLAIAIKTTIHKDLGASKSVIILHYLSHPGDFLRVMSSTLTNDDTLTFYIRSFFGILGRLNASFQPPIYNYLIFATLLFFLLSLPLPQRKYLAPGLLLICIGGSSIILVFVSLLVSWTPYPASVVEGVQGRYFLMPIIIICYGVTLQIRRPFDNKVYHFFCASALIIFSLFSVQKTGELLLDRYFVSDTQLFAFKIGSYTTDRIYGELTKGRAFSQSFRAEGNYIFKVRLFLATLSRKNTGIAKLSILDAAGKSLFEKLIDVKALVDNAWIDIPAGGFGVERGRTYVLRLTSPYGVEGNSISWWASNHDSYKDGNAFVDSTRAEGDFAFEVFTLP